MTKIDIYSGFLGAGKTTLISKLIKEAYKDQKIVLIENEFGEIGIDGGFLKDAGVEITEMNSGCICCSLTGDFRKSLLMVEEQYHPDRILIEPSGVGKLSEVAAAVMSTGSDAFELGGLTTVVDAGKCKMYLKNFGEFFLDQVKTAKCIVLSRTGVLSEEKVAQAVALLKEQNDEATIITADWAALDGQQILDAIDGRDELSETLKALIDEHVDDEDEECDDPDCECHHHHHHDDDDDEHEHHHHHHHHHDHDEDECDDPDCECHHHHHHGHDADEVFGSFGVETAKRFTEKEIEDILTALNDTEKYGMVLRAKGIVECSEGGWIHFDFTPGENNVRKGPAAVTGMLCVIGAQLNEHEVKELLGV